MYGHPHCHLLALGRGITNGSPKTLLGVSHEFWERRWALIAKASATKVNVRAAKIEPLRNIIKASSYIARHLRFPKSTWSELYVYNRKLLAKTQLADCGRFNIEDFLID
jgi:hypothetical protein